MDGRFFCLCLRRLTRRTKEIRRRGNLLGHGLARISRIGKDEVFTAVGRDVLGAPTPQPTASSASLSFSTPFSALNFADRHLPQSV